MALNQRQRFYPSLSSENKESYKKTKKTRRKAATAKDYQCTTMNLITENPSSFIARSLLQCVLGVSVTSAEQLARSFLFQNTAKRKQKYGKSKQATFFSCCLGFSVVVFNCLPPVNQDGYTKAMDRRPRRRQRRRRRRRRRRSEEEEEDPHQETRRSRRRNRINTT